MSLFFFSFTDLSPSRSRLIQDLEPFSRCNPESANFDPLYDPTTLKKEDGSDLTIGIQPVQGEIVKSVVFSQWTTLLDRFVSLCRPSFSIETDFLLLTLQSRRRPRAAEHQVPPPRRLNEARGA